MHSVIVVPDVTIGFNSTVYSVSEETSSVNITVSILSGILTRNALLIVDNRDGSAQGNFNLAISSLTMHLIALDVQSHPML